MSSDNATTTNTPAVEITSSSSNNNSQRNGSNRSRSRRNQSRNNQVTTSNPVSYEGDTPGVGAVLALRLEKLDKKLPYEQFVEKVYLYAVTNYKDGGDLQVLFLESKDPLKYLEENEKPRRPTNDKDEDYAEDMDIYKAEITIFTQRKLNLRRSREKSFGLTWGQCSSALQSYVKGISKYTERSRKFDLQWLLQELKKATAGIDDKANPYVSLHNALGTLYKMNQGEHEPNDRYLERFKTNVIATELTYGSHIFYSAEIAGKTRDEASAEEIRAEEEKSKAVLLLMNSDTNGRYNDLTTSLEDGAHL